MHWSDERVLVTGGNGFLGAYVVRAVAEKHPMALFAPGRQELDLMLRASIRAFLSQNRPTVVIHCAGTIGGIAANARHPATFLYQNAIMGLELLEGCRLFGVKRVLVVGTSCEYPENAQVPISPTSLWNGEPTRVTAPYGHAKRLLFAHGQACAQEHGMRVSHVILSNLYGPGDHFEDDDKSHVLIALVRRCLQAKAHGAESLTVWGDGTCSREFLFVEDAARGILLAAERDPCTAVLNLGSGVETTIAALARMVTTEVGFAGTLIFDRTKPNGTPKRCLDNSVAFQLGYRPQVELREGLARTVAWLRSLEFKHETESQAPDGMRGTTLAVDHERTLSVMCGDHTAIDDP